MENLERDMSVEQAVKIGLSFLKESNLNINLKTYRLEQDTEDVNIVVVNDENNKTLSIGKGLGKQSMASGIFEAIEHYMYDNIQNIKTPRKKLTVEEIIKYEPKFKKMISIQLLKESAITNVLSLEFRSLLEDKIIYFPEILLSTSEEEYLSNYISNNGFATGTNISEARIHAINEVIERHSISVNYINYFIYGSSEVKMICHDSLPERLRIMVKKIEMRIGARINICNFTTIKGIYTFYSWAKVKKCILPIKGSGASIFPWYALERSLTELFQMYVVYDDCEREEDLNIINNYEHYPLLKKIINRSFKSTDIKLEPFTTTQLPMMEGSQNILEYMLQCLKSENLDVFDVVLYDKKCVVCVKVIIPGTENFQIVDQGKFVLPNNT